MEMQFSPSFPNLSLILIPLLLSGSVWIRVDGSSNEIHGDITNKSSRVIDSITKSATDGKEYRGIILPNGLTALLISNPNATKAAASLAVSVGSLNDPPEVSGLAHFVEHMIYLGNAKYPLENSFQKYLSEHGGYSNAATQMDETYYFFRVAPTFLKESLERFAKSFISPLFTSSALEREVKAIDSEHQKYIPDDRRRLDRVETFTMKANHPYTQFRTGSLETLWKKVKRNGIDLRGSLVDFHQKYYSSNLMQLAVLGNGSLDSLQSMVEEIFREIPRRNNSSITSWENPMGKDETGERLEVVPVGDVRSLTLTFPVKYVAQYYKTTGLGYTAQLVGLESPGSLCFYLKKKNLAHSVIVGPHLAARGISFFKIKLALTPNGFEEINNVTRAVFQYIKMMKDTGPKKWFWEEIRDVGKLHFHFMDEIYPMEFVSKLSILMDKYPLEKILYSGRADLLGEFNPEDITEAFNHLNPRSFRLTVSSKAFTNATNLTEPDYGVKYNRVKIDADLIKDWESVESNPEFHMPNPNEFIPTELTLKERDEQSALHPLVPRKLKETNLSEIWYLQDTEYHLPKAVITVEIYSPSAYMDPLSTNLNYIWIVLISQSMGEFQYNGNIAGLECQLINTATGIHLTIKGYNHKLAMFLDKVLQKIVNFNVDPELFETAKDSRQRFLRNRKDAEPHEFTSEQIRLLLKDRNWSKDELLEALEDVSISGLSRFVLSFMERLKLLWFFYGNLTPEESLAIANAGEQIFISNGSKPLLRSQLSPIRVIELKPGSNFVSKVHHATHTSSCTVVLFQIGLDNTKQNMLAQLLARILHTFSYDRLRTKEQLGYVVWGDVQSDQDRIAFSVRLLVQGTNPNTDFIESRINKCLLDFKEILNNMTNFEFSKHQRSLYEIKTTNPKNMEDRAALVFKEIRTRRENFLRQQNDLDALNKLTLKEFKDFFMEKIHNPETFRRLSVHTIGIASKNGSSNTNNDFPTYAPSIATEITDPISWKESMGLFPTRITMESISNATR